MANAGTGASSLAQATIDISVGRLQQLFYSLDPSPFHDRDLDHDAEEYILSSAEEIALQRPLKLIVHLPPDQLAHADQAALERAIHNYFAYQQRQLQRRLRLLFHDGRIALAVGIAFLFVCVLIRQLILGMARVPYSKRRIMMLSLLTLDLAVSAFVLFGRRNPCGSVVAGIVGEPLPSM